MVEDEFEEAYTMEPAATLRAAHDPRYWVDVRVDGKIVHGLLDTGATRTIMPCTVVQPEELPDRRLRGYGGQEVHTLGTATAAFEANGRSIACRCFVVSPGKCPLFGQDVIQQLQLVTVTVDEPDINTVTMPPVDIADINTVTMRPVDIAVDPNMPLPESQSDVRRFLGMLTYLGKFIPGLEDATAPVRTLAKREPFVADNSLWMEFNTLKEEAASRLLRLSFFDVTPTRETAISVDASPCGLGAILWQKDNHGRFQPVSCASRALKDPETRYSQLEREMLAVVFGLVKFRQFVLGRQVIVFTDHKPLVAIVKKEFDQVPARVQRWLLAILPYDFQLTYTPGTSMICTDALSRAPSQAVEASPAEARSMKEYIGLILGEAPISCEDVRLATDTDGQLSRVRNSVTRQVEYMRRQRRGILSNKGLVVSG